MTPVQNSDAIDSGINADINSVAYYVNIATNDGAGGTISKDIEATYQGTLGVITDVVKVTSNTPNGYQIYLSAASGHDQRLTNTTDNTKYLSPVDTASYSLPSTPGTLATANTWGVAVDPSYNSAFSGQDYSGTITQAHKFAPLPANGAEKLLARKDTATTGGTDTINVYYGYHANSALPSGTYANTVLYTAYSDSATTDIATYTGDLNYKTGGTIQFTTSLFTDRTLPTTSEVSVTIGGNPCTVTNVGKVNPGTNDSVTITCTAPAQTKPGTYSTVVSIDSFGYNASTTVAYETDGITIGDDTITTMQQFATVSGACASWTQEGKTTAAFTDATPTYSYGNGVTEAQITANPTSTDYWTTAVAGAAQMTNINTNVPETYLKDDRDGQYYRIRKLADGNCWMTENLKLQLDNTVAVETQDGTDWTPTNSTETSSNKTVWGNDASGDIDAQITAQSIASGDQANFRASYYDHSYYNTNKQSTLDGESQDIGVYYNWNAATAGTGTWANTSATNSICPKGWQLPTGTTANKSWYYLTYTTYGAADLNTGDRRVSQVSTPTYKDYHTYAMTNALRRAPLSLPFTGDYDYPNGAISGVGGHGLWWTSTVSSNQSARRLYFLSGAFYPQCDVNKGYGFTVRCVAQ